MPSLVSVPENSLLDIYKQKGDFTDCYMITLPTAVSLPQFIEAFYTTRLFKLERWILATFLNYQASDEQATQLSLSNISLFSAWQVEKRLINEIILSAWQTRSWLCVAPQQNNTASTQLYFGSAVVSAQSTGKVNPLFHLLGGFHKLYSKLLLRAAANKVMVNLNKSANHH